MKKSAYLGWAIGSFTSAAMVSVIGLLHLRFMTDSLGISIAIAGTITVVAKIYDAATDPLMGVIGDRTRTRWGKFRPYIFIGGLLAGLSLILLFNTPERLREGGLIAFLLMAKLLFSTAYTMFRIPYLAIGRSITQNFDERSKLMTFSVYGSSIGSITATAGAPFLLAEIGSDRAGHGVIALILALMVWIGTVATFALLKETREPETESRPNASLGETWRALIANRPFGCLIGFKVAIFSGLGLQLAALPYYTRHVLDVSDRTLGSILLFTSLAMMASQYFWVKAARRYGRRNALLAASGFTMVKMIGWSLVPAGSPVPWVQILGIIGGIGSGGIFLGLYTILTDTMDYSRRAHGDNHAGILAGIFVMVEKVTSAFGVFLFSLFMALFGFASATDAGAAVQSPEVRSAIVVALSIIPTCLALIACMFIWRYRLPDQPVVPEEQPGTMASQAG